MPNNIDFLRCGVSRGINLNTEFISVVNSRIILKVITENIETFKKSQDRHKISFSYDFNSKKPCTAVFGNCDFCSEAKMPFPVMIKVN